ncbi:hypothetical protein EI168_02595 [Halomonas sp. FME1]|uniref:Phage protein n=1 Tax=Halomonas casei TaxID=2742613 RepID=A0ABR9EXQ0_9GAMM|nr:MULTISPECIES: hypothetical protein [Halomonas]MBE0398997.1 hypothetical protein [Halomonas casei]PCC23017.1 hypothetical protein CIK78_13650 [Halomonas sp. JB37]
MSAAKHNIDALESRIGLMATLANMINIDRMRNGNEGEAPIYSDYHYGSLVEAIDIVAESCYRELGQLDEKLEQEGKQ